MSSQTRTYTNFDLSQQNGPLTGVVVVVRTRSATTVEAGVFEIDLGCMGVTDAIYFKETQAMIEDVVAKEFDDSERFEHSGAWGRKFVEGARDYALRLGFAAHRDYKKAARVFGGVSAGDCDEQFEYGSGGKPLYFASGRHSPDMVQRILAILKAKCGEGGYHFLVPDGDSYKEGEEDDFEDRVEGDHPLDEEVERRPLAGDSSLCDVPVDLIRDDGELRVSTPELDHFLAQQLGDTARLHLNDPVKHIDACDVADVLWESAASLGEGIFNDEDEAKARSIGMVLLQLAFGFVGMTPSEIRQTIKKFKSEVPAELLIKTVPYIEALIEDNDLPRGMLVQHEIAKDREGEDKLLVLYMVF